MPKEVKSLEKPVILIVILLIIIFMLVRKLNTLYQISYIDCLTGAYNRRYLEKYFRKKIHKKKFALACIMIDIDGFKKINDKHGHGTGDEVLKQTVGLLHKTLNTIRKADFIVRYGGDEFFIFLHTDDLQEVKKIAEQVKSFEKCLGISYSIGYDVYDTFRWEDFKQFMHHVDALMYQNKRKNNAMT